MLGYPEFRRTTTFEVFCAATCQGRTRNDDDSPSRSTQLEEYVEMFLYMREEFDINIILYDIK